MTNANDDSISALVAKAHGQSVRSGFWEDEPTDDQELRSYLGNKLMLIVGEVAEAHEELRKPQPIGTAYYSRSVDFTQAPPGDEPEAREKPEGLPSELADVMIRVADLAGWLGIDLAAVIVEKRAYNATRARKHGKRF